MQSSVSPDFQRRFARATAHGGDFDVLCGRGHHNYNSPGTFAFREEIKRRTDDYKACLRRSHKTNMVEVMTDMFRSAGCKFVKRDKNKEDVELTLVEVRKKVAHAFRDAIQALKVASGDVSPRARPSTASKTIKKKTAKETPVKKKRAATKLTRSTSHVTIAMTVSASSAGSPDQDISLEQDGAHSMEYQPMFFPSDAARPDIPLDSIFRESCIVPRSPCTATDDYSDQLSFYDESHDGTCDLNEGEYIISDAKLDEVLLPEENLVW